MPFAIPSMLFRRYAVLRSPWFAGIPFPRYADQCFSASWWRNSIPTRICAVLFRRFAVRSKLILRKSNLFNATGVSTRLEPIPVPRCAATLLHFSGALPLTCLLGQSFAFPGPSTRAKPYQAVSIRFNSGAALCSYAAFVSLVFWAVAMRRVGLHFRSGAVHYNAYPMPSRRSSYAVIRPRTPPCSSA